MKKSVVPAKSRGVILFAFNTNDIDYIEIARQSARLIHQTLNLPVTLVTDLVTNSDIFDNVVYTTNILSNVKPDKGTNWRNGGRYQAYELSPYEETLLIDSDYLMLDPSLLKLFDQEFDYRIMTHNSSQDGTWPDRMGPYGLPYQWATSILFRKTSKAEMLFDLVSRIQRNYGYYLNLYHIKYGSFRNDYAFTIANNILNGYDQGMDQGIPWPMLTFTDVIKSLTIKNSMVILKGKTKAFVLPKMNIHIMDKEYLLSDDFSNFVGDVCIE